MERWQAMIRGDLEGLKSPRPRCVFLFLPICACQKGLPRSVDSPSFSMHW